MGYRKALCADRQVGIWAGHTRKGEVVNESVMRSCSCCVGERKLEKKVWLIYQSDDPGDQLIATLVRRGKRAVWAYPAFGWHCRKDDVENTPMREYNRPGQSREAILQTSIPVFGVNITAV